VIHHEYSLDKKTAKELKAEIGERYKDVIMVMNKKIIELELRYEQTLKDLRRELDESTNLIVLQ